MLILNLMVMRMPIFIHRETHGEEKNSARNKKKSGNLLTLTERVPELKTLLISIELPTATVSITI